MSGERAEARAEAYYDSGDADRFYFEVWGGEDIHVGIYDETDDIAAASRQTVERMAAMVEGAAALHPLVLDIGAGYGGAARYLARSRGWPVRCLNISEVQNAKNAELTRAAGLEEWVTVRHGSFEDIPEPDEAFDVVWSQDALLHSGDRGRVFDEAWRVLKPGGEFIFTDPMQADDVPPGSLAAVYDRLHLADLGSFASYRAMAGKRGFETVAIVDLSPNLRIHYGRVAATLRLRAADMVGKVSEGAISRLLTGLANWLNAADSGHLRWGILQFRKPRAGS